MFMCNFIFVYSYTTTITSAIFLFWNKLATPNFDNLGGTRLDDERASSSTQELGILDIRRLDIGYGTPQFK